MQSRVLLFSAAFSAAATSILWNVGALAALDCPPPPSQVTQATRIEIEGELGTFKRLLGGSGRLEYEEKAEEIFSRYPNADKIVINNFLISVFCQLLNDSTQLSDKEKFQQLFDFSEQVTKASAPEKGDKFPPKAQISALKSAFNGKDQGIVRMSLGRALDSPSEFIQNMALKALLGGVKNVYSGVLFYRQKPMPFLIKITSFNEVNGTFTGEFSGWNEKFEGQLSGTTLIFIGSGYTFSVNLKPGEVLEGDAWEGCLKGSPSRYECVPFQSARIKLF